MVRNALYCPLYFHILILQGMCQISLLQISVHVVSVLNELKMDCLF